MIVAPPPIGDGAGPPECASASRRTLEARQRRRTGPIGMIVNTLKPSNWFARAREFGEKIEQAGNDILPNIRQQ